VRCHTRSPFERALRRARSSGDRRLPLHTEAFALELEVAASPPVVEHVHDVPLTVSPRRRINADPPLLRVARRVRCHTRRSSAVSCSTRRCSTGCAIAARIPTCCNTASFGRSKYPPVRHERLGPRLVRRHAPRRVHLLPDLQHPRPLRRGIAACGRGRDQPYQRSARRIIAAHRNRRHGNEIVRAYTRAHRIIGTGAATPVGPSGTRAVVLGGGRRAARD